MKYDALEQHLKSLPKRDIPMKFSEIETVIGQRLPASARRHPAWWSNNPSNNVATYAWLRSGFMTASLSIPDERVVFRPAEDRLRLDAAEKKRGPSAERPARFGLFGRLAGSVTLHGWDLTQPTGERWNADSGQ